MDEPSIELLARYRTGDEQAATELFRRYVSRLTALARARIAPRIGRRFDAEDVVLSAYRSFFVRARDGQFSLAHSGDLWRLLVGIVLRKLYHQVDRHTAERRSIDREQPLPAGGESAWEAVLFSRANPSAEETIAMAELVESLMSQLEPLSRQVVELRLQNCRISEIVAATQRSERTIRRILHDLRQRLATLLRDADDAPRSLPTTPDEAAEPEDADCDRGSVDDMSVDVAATDGRPATILPAEMSRTEFLSDRDFVLQVHLGTGGTGRVYRAL